VINKDALRLTRGGPTLGTPATHFVPPGMPGFEQAGGVKGPGYDFMSQPNGNLSLAESYMKKGGFPSGNVNIAQANDPTLNKQMDTAERITDPTQRAAAWAKLDDEVTAQAFVVPWLWDNEVTFASKNVHGVNWAFNGNTWDLANSYAVK
jgi:ABC-type transport system substrate-binding protein